jgi:methylmalonyl-CoA mutase
MTKHPIRALVAVKSNDGHDRPLRYIADAWSEAGIEVIYAGYDLIWPNLVDAVVQEHPQIVGISSYNSGHIEYILNVRDDLLRRGYPHVHIVAGGGATITEEDRRVLEGERGIDRIFGPRAAHDAVGFIKERYDFSTVPERPENLVPKVLEGDQLAVSLFLNVAEEKARLDSLLVRHLERAVRDSQPSILSRLSRDAALEDGRTVAEAAELAARYKACLDALAAASGRSRASVIGVTGRGGSGKSTLVDELAYRYFADEKNRGRRLAIVAIDPGSDSGGAILRDRQSYVYAGDRKALFGEWSVDPSTGRRTASAGRVFIRSASSRKYGKGICRALPDMLTVFKAAGYDVIVETYGTGQEETEIARLADRTVFVTTHDMGGEKQVSVERMLGVPGVYVVLNKSDKKASGAVRSLLLTKVPRDRLFSTTASDHNDAGLNALYERLSSDIAGVRHAA